MGSMIEARKRYHNAYQTEHYKTVSVTVNRDKDADVLTRLTEQKNVSGYVRELVKRDINNTGHWIPCSEGLPLKKGRYLCTVGAEYHNVREMIYDPDEFISEEYMSIWKNIDGYRAFNWFVIAWMPMPKPFKKNEVEDGKTD